MSNLTFNKYPFLKELGLSEHNHGVYYGGKWTGNDKDVAVSYNPSTGEAIATTS